MPRQLPGVIDLIKDSWTLFTTTWNDSVKISIWFLYFGLVNFLLFFLQKFSPAATTLLSIPVSLAIGIVAYWVGVRLMRAMLQLESGKKIDFSKEESMRTWNLLLPNLWVGILQMLIVLGGTVLFIIPGIYLGVALSFAQLFVIDQGLRGMKALGASRDLIKGRWWGTAWRLFATGIIFGLGVSIATGIVFSAMTMIAGPAEALAKNPDPLFLGTRVLFTSIIQAAVLPLFVGLHVKIYRALLATRD